MARLRSTSPVGVPPRDTSVDASIFRRWLATAAGDAALAADLATGANSTTPIDHSGAPNGCQIRLPLAAQHIGRSIAIDPSGADGSYYILPVPVFVRSGEDGQYRLTAEVTPFGADPVTLEVRNTSWALTVNPTPGDRDDAQFILASTGSSYFGNVITWTFDLAVGLQYILVKRLCRIEDTGATLFNWILEHRRTGVGQSNGILVNGTTAQGSPYGALSSFEPSTVLDFYDEEVVVDGPLNGFVTSRLNRKLSGLWEYVTGGKVPGNNAYQSSTTWNNNRSTWAAEALIEFPIACVAVGASADIGSPKNPTSSSMPTWIRYPDKHSTTASTFCGTILQMPSFRTSTSDLKVEVLMEAPNNDTLVDWRFDAVGSAAATEVAPTQIGGSRWWRAQITGVPFTTAATNQLDVRVRHVGPSGALSKLVQITGVCAYFDP
jgi:hypothetical protein